MPRKKSYITITDQFCGAGGSSQGARALSREIGGGLEISLALNHWRLAIETHQSNFPDTQHDCTDVSACDPRRYPSTDILITSPECTNHSLAKGKKQVKAQLDMYEQGIIDPAADRSRATMWDVPRFAEYHNYRAIIVENVVDARKWVQFPAWIHAMELLGYNHKAVYMNSMFCHPTPQSRDRMYVIFWKKDQRTPDLEYHPRAYCNRCDQDISAVQSWKRSNVRYGVYGRRGQYLYCCPTCSFVVQPYYHAAFNCIDWSDTGTRIGDREKKGRRPLSENTLRRIRYGLKKYGSEPLMVVNYSPGYSKSLREAAATFTGNDHQALLTSPFIIDDKQTTGVDFRVRSVKEYIPTVHTDPRMKIVMPFIVKAEHSNQNNVRPANEPFQTQTTRQSMALVTPMLVELNRTGKAKPATAPLSTVTAGVINQGIVCDDAWKRFITYYYSTSQASHISEPLGTVSTSERCWVVQSAPEINDCYYRMLKPAEIKLGMAFDHDYLVLGSGKDQVKQLGNAVTPPVMKWLVGQLVKTL